MFLTLWGGEYFSTQSTSSAIGDSKRALTLAYVVVISANTKNLHDYEWPTFPVKKAKIAELIKTNLPFEHKMLLQTSFPCDMPPQLFSGTLACAVGEEKLRP